MAMIHRARSSDRFPLRTLTTAAGMAALLLLTPLSEAAADLRPATHDQAAALVCPMHPNVRSKEPGTCSICGMSLVPVDSSAGPKYDVEVQTTPRAIVAGRPFRLHLTVRHPATKAVVQDFAVVHEKRFHLFVISQDLEDYDHVHPEQQADGSWALDMSLPRPGPYKIYADFLPSGGTPQVLVRPLVTSDVSTEDAAGNGARLVPDRSLNHTIGDLSVTLQLPPGGLIAGREERFVYTLADARTGKPVRDIEPYLGAWGHSLALSEDMSRVVHAHPVELVPDGRPASRSGPTLTFKASLPEPGAYRIWTQIKRNGELVTAVFTVTAIPPRAPAPSGGESLIMRVVPGDLSGG